jgi:hypothetical protein
MPGSGGSAVGHRRRHATRSPLRSGLGSTTLRRSSRPISSAGVMSRPAASFVIVCSSGMRTPRSMPPRCVRGQRRQDQGDGAAQGVTLCFEQLQGTYRVGNFGPPSRALRPEPVFATLGLARDVTSELTPNESDRPEGRSQLTTWRGLIPNPATVDGTRTVPSSIESRNRGCSGSRWPLERCAKCCALVASGD